MYSSWKRNKNVFWLILSLLVAVPFFQGCGDDDDENLEWSYEGDTGPEHWAELDPKYSTCGDGTAQSPIDIVGTTPQALDDLVMQYETIPLSILNNGHTIEIEYEEDGTLTVDGETYQLVQFHFHRPSEHEVNGQLAAMELHLVHRNEAGDLAVVGVLIESGAENPAFSGMWNNLPDEKDEHLQPAGVEINAEDLLPASGKTYRYSGSLTTPPCTEGVQWFMMTSPIELSAAQISRYNAIFDHTNRPVQPLNGRQILEDNS